MKAFFIEFSKCHIIIIIITWFFACFTWVLLATTRMAHNIGKHAIIIT